MPRPVKNTSGYYGDGKTKRNAENHRLNVMIRRDKHKQQLVEYFNNKCNDCGLSFPICCYDFHHIDSSTKSFEIAPRLDGNINTIMEEVKKCIMVCSNCHRIRHYKENRSKSI
jgi:hypothetical protein